MVWSLDYSGVVTEVNAKLVDLLEAIGVDDPEELGNPDVTSPAQRMAGYAYVFVTEDGSHGVHNPTYALDLLDNAIAFMQTVNAAQRSPIARK